ncbi:hypothetical protein SLEP1_g42707 [Rubroshorea leprosula]|uniref:Uncharacterized protein n=1 Tax=Rubroshorea leprosula TaxID=152421 RepID=A0AAV5LBR1_9ROSI|nr:hypothetical protein SLEP1_g42707 [Rubroshorea leprosula]
MPYTDLTKLSSILSTDGELCTYPDHVEWCQSKSNLQPSKHLDKQPSTSQMPSRFTIITNEGENTDCTKDSTRTEPEMATGISHLCQEEINASSKEDGVQFHGATEESDSSQSLIGAPNSNHLITSNGNQSTRTSETPMSGVSPPVHNANSVSNHPMMTRTQSGTHTGHVQTKFTKHAHTMTTNDSSLNLVGLHTQEPKSVRQALQLPHWVKAMQEELDALQKN